ncbi:TPA: ABC-three component system middle component 6 [Legionella pneumophila]|uniref:ABC-three component system middle component 6 n=1 Tax=Legionella pneumophila TaxID=446 RepID=UPI0007782612|nr:ABC-three component system middle component 6 [Legionella pneumophila]HCC3234913.1 hypothetical protein [Legionella pneumophila subsp. pneumophila]HAT8621968.1 hypothetical protein [Legionella pneumophila]HAU9853221.1 hypothetical protein [Legionella pneumophila]HAU9908218.1 hypothetical protein [Legionella pneumophila]HAV0029396.1 hypothetical protein [Legionella pneumophila]
MILPTKYIPTNQALIGAGAIILNELNRKPTNVSTLWEIVRDASSIGNYERFVLALDMLHIIGAIELKNNLIRKSEK